MSGCSSEITWQRWSLERRRRPRRRERALSLPVCGGTRRGTEVKYAKKETFVVAVTSYRRQGETQRRQTTVCSSALFCCFLQSMSVTHRLK